MNIAAKYKILLLVNNSELRHLLFKEFEIEAELFHAERFDDIIAELKWAELDMVLIDAGDDKIDSGAIVQLLNTVCPSVGVVMIAKQTTDVIQQLIEMLPHIKLLVNIGTPREIATLVAPIIRAAARQSRQVRTLDKPDADYRQAINANADLINRHLIRSMMQINVISGEFQIDRNELSLDGLRRMENFTTELDNFLAAYKNREEKAELQTSALIH